jgi:8-oxo-dGTP pyrophosphatase MutT (NUDIX family)
MRFRIDRQAIVRFACPGRVVREVREETGLEVEPEAIVGVYSNPQHVVECTDGEVRQQ